MEGHAGTENLELPEAGTVTGAVTDQSNPVAGASVDVCANEACYQTQTDGFGSYSIGEVSDGEYVTTVAPSHTYDSATSPKFIVSGRATSTVNLTVSRTGRAPGGHRNARQPDQRSRPNSVAVPLFFWQARAPLKTIACVGGSVTATVTGHQHPDPGSPDDLGPVTLAEGPNWSGKFEGQLPTLYPSTVRSRSRSNRRLPAPSEEEETKNSTPTWTPAGSSWTAIMPIPDIRSNGHAAGRHAELQPVHSGAERLDRDVAGEPQKLRHHELDRRIRLGHAAGLVRGRSPQGRVRRPPPHPSRSRHR